MKDQPIPPNSLIQGSNDASSASEIQIIDFSGEVLVVNKPGGLLTQAPPGIPSVESWARQQFRSKDPSSFYVGMVHRLDRPASGVLVIGQNKQVTRKLSTQFEKRTVKKTYWALVTLPKQDASKEEGFQENGTWTDWMRKIPNKPMSEICNESDPDAKSARLHYKLLGSADGVGLLEIQLETGRTHQIRLQTSSRGYPILGDYQYQSAAPFGPETDDQRKRWIALHAREIDFWHPRHHVPTTLTAKPPLFWKPYLEKMGLPLGTD